MALTQVSSNKCAGGFQKVFEHDSTELKCKMKFAVYLPPKAESGKCPSCTGSQVSPQPEVRAAGWREMNQTRRRHNCLTCTEQNFITKAGSQLAAAEHGIIIVAPDTSPRGCDIEGENESWDFGTGAGFYVDATQDPWKTNYRMYSYITEELPKLINANFPTDPDRMSISGHSMGGHGALICALKNPGKYKVPHVAQAAKKAFSGYLGSDRSTWEAYDATVLAGSYSGPQLDILIDQGRDDQFLSASQLLPDNLIAVCSEKKIPVVFRLQPGYDHSYFFIYSFMNDHIKHHAKYLNA
ncbi:hypothetical protein INR49_002346 [Caranx melampygus]|nr:hypothetical protein INR49_002346 [Caranx melampygus]